VGWTEAVDNYCERTGPEFWSEPVNAVTNLAFIIAALVVWAMLGGRRDPGARVLTGVLFAIGVGSFLFHTYATGWAGMLDVLPIVVFILIYIYLATTRFFGTSRVIGIGAVVAFFPYAALVSWLVASTFGPLNGSVAYIPVPILILGYAAALFLRDRPTAIGLAVGAGILFASLFFRTVDETVCGSFPLGTHFMWHVLNGIMLGWMIIVYHRAARPGQPG